MTFKTLSATVPECFIGLWRRRVLESGPLHDTTTEAWRLQTGRLYADLRLPAGAPTPQCPTLRRGFAGPLEVQGDVLTWYHWLDVEPPTGIADVGQVHFEGDRLIERGVLASYREIWERTAAASDDRLALALRDECADGGEWRARRGVFVVLGDYFMLALDRSLFLSRGGTIPAGRVGAFAVFRLDCEISLGVRRGRVPWEIQRSTLPQREGQSLSAIHGLPEHDCGHEWLQRVHLPTALRRWQAVEIGTGFRGLV
ncbi:MAG: hypothetical protein ACYDDO_13625 [Acidiferrobacterales bacterium]